MENHKLYNKSEIEETSLPGEATTETEELFTSVDSVIGAIFESPKLQRHYYYAHFQA